LGTLSRKTKIVRSKTLIQNKTKILRSKTLTQNLHVTRVLQMISGGFGCQRD